jgi:hypothetical protein
VVLSCKEAAVKQFALVSLIALGLFAFLALPAWSQTGDSVDAVVTPFSVAISIDETTIEFGTVGLSASNVTRTTKDSPTAITVDNVGSATADLVIQGENATPANVADSTWTLDCEGLNGTVGLDRFALLFLLGDFPANNDWAAAKPMCPDPTTTTLQNDVAPAGTSMFVLQLQMPTGMSGFSQRTIPVTVTATQAAPQP